VVAVAALAALGDAKKADGVAEKGFATEGEESGTPDQAALSEEAYQRRVGRAKGDPGGWKRVVAAGESMQEVNVDADSRGMPASTAEDLAARWIGLAKRYPDAAERWVSVGPDKRGTRVGFDENIVYAKSGGGMHWNYHLMCRGRARLDEDLLQSEGQGIHPPGCGNVTALATHEFGHVVEDVVRRQIGEHAWESLNGKLRSHSLSGYTEGDPDECFAEAFMAMHHADAGSPGAQQAGRLVAEVLRSLGMWSG